MRQRYAATWFRPSRYLSPQEIRRGHSSIMYTRPRGALGADEYLRQWLPRGRTALRLVRIRTCAPAPTRARGRPSIHWPLYEGIWARDPRIPYRDPTTLSTSLRAGATRERVSSSQALNALRGTPHPHHWAAMCKTGAPYKKIRMPRPKTSSRPDVFAKTRCLSDRKTPRRNSGGEAVGLGAAQR